MIVFARSRPRSAAFRTPACSLVQRLLVNAIPRFCCFRRIAEAITFLTALPISDTARSRLHSIRQLQCIPISASRPAWKSCAVMFCTACAQLHHRLLTRPSTTLPRDSRLVIGVLVAVPWGRHRKGTLVSINFRLCPHPSQLPRYAQCLISLHCQMHAPYRCHHKKAWFNDVPCSSSSNQIQQTAPPRK